jgi:hypothetical protein
MTSNSSSGLKKYSLVLYFILAYALTWCFEIPIALSAQGLIEANIPWPCIISAPLVP